MYFLTYIHMYNVYLSSIQNTNTITQTKPRESKETTKNDIIVFYRKTFILFLRFFYLFFITKQQKRRATATQRNNNSTFKSCKTSGIILKLPSYYSFFVRIKNESRNIHETTLHALLCSV